MRRLIARILTRAGYDVLEARDGKEGLRLFHGHRPLLVITDLVMPQAEGIETIRELRNQAPDLPIIAISGRDVMFLDVARKLGANVAIAKPFRASELVGAVKTLIAR